MVKQSMDLLELLRKRGMDGDVDFLREALREALRVLVDGIMDAEVSALVLQRNRVQLRLLAHPLIQSSGEFRRFSSLWLYTIPVGIIARDRAGKAFKVRPS